MKLNKKHLAISISLTNCLFVTSFVHAQIEEVIITAERREASLQETDISMTVMDDKTLQEMGATSPQDIGNFAPNVMIHELPGTAGVAIGIRGFKNGETIATYEPKVALYMDGVLIAKNTGAAFDVLDLERIEILRGPQGTLYGRNTAGGAVNLITKKPYDTFGGSVSATMGEFNQRDVKATVNAPITEGLSVKATLASLNRDGYWYNPTRHEDVGDKSRDVIHTQLRWNPVEEVDILYAYDRTEIDEIPLPRQLVDFNPSVADLSAYVGDGSSSIRDSDARAYQDGKIEGHSLTATWDIHDSLSLASISSYREMRMEYGFDSDTTPKFLFHNESGDHTQTFTQEVRLLGSMLDDRVEYVVGAFYMDEEIVDSFNTQILPNFGYLAAKKNYGALNENWAVFGEVSYSITDALEITGGLRYTDEQREMSRVDTTIIPAFGMNKAVEFPTASGEFDDVSGMLSLSYQWTGDLMTYFKVAKGYVSGGFNARAPSAAIFLLGYDEETVLSYELGWKSSWFANRLVLNGAVFYNDYQDLQVNQLTDLGENNFDNAGDASIQGFEIELQASPVDSVQIGGGYGYLDPQYKTYINEGLPNDPSDDQDLSDNDWAHAPAHSLNFFARYEIPDFRGIGDLSFRTDWSYRSKHSVLTATGNEVKGYDFANVRVQLDNIGGPAETNVKLGLWGKNVTDETWYVQGYNLNNVLGFRGLATSAPRSFGVDVAVEF